MKVESKSMPRGQVELTIEITTEEYQPFLKQAAQKISEKTSIDGFRPGKADYDLIVRRVGEAEIWQQAFDGAVYKTLVSALDEKKLITVGSPHVDVVTLAPGNPVVYKATVAILPEVKLAELDKLKVEPKTAEINDKQLEQTLSDLQKMRAKENLTEKEVAKGDKVEISFEIFLDSVPFENGKNDNFSMVIGEGKFVPGFEDQIIGMKTNEEKTFPLTFPKDYFQKNLAGKKVDMKVKVKAVYEVDLPKLDDEFAKSLGGFENLKELKDKVKENLIAEAQVKQDRETEEAVIEKVIEASSFSDIPDLLVDSETKKMIEELERDITGRGITFEDYLTHLKKSRQDLLLEFAPQAVKRVKSALVMREISQAQKLDASNEEINSEIELSVARFGDSPEIRDHVAKDEYRNYIRNIIVSQKAMDYLKSVVAKKA